MRIKHPESAIQNASSTSPVSVLKHIESLLDQNAAGRRQQRERFLDAHKSKIVLIDEKHHLLVDVFVDEHDVEPDDYNLATVKAVDLPYTIDFSSNRAAELLAEVLLETRGTELIGIPLDALWKLEQELFAHDQPATKTEQLLGALATHSHATR